MPPGVTQPGRLTPNANLAGQNPGYAPRGPVGPVGQPSRGGMARRVAQKAVKSRVPTRSTGARGNASDPPIIPSAPTAPPTAAVNPEDQALQGTYPTDLNITQNSSLKGLAGQVQLPNALNYANAMANMQYGPQIQATAGRIKGLIAALPGALDSLNKAFANVDAQRQLNAPITSGQGVANLFGGAQGAAAVAANQAVQANNTTANQIGQGNDEAQANARRQADWATRIQLLNNLSVNQGRSELAGEVGAKGAAQKGFYDQGLKMRGDMISQAISNQGALSNQKIAAALASGQIEGMKLSNEQKAVLIKQLGIQTAYLPDQLQAGIQGQKQNIITSQLNNGINLATAKARINDLNQKSNGGVTNLAQALGAGGAGAVGALILPPDAVALDQTKNRPVVYGDLNTYYNKGVDAIMANLPGSNRNNVKKYVLGELQKVASLTNQWVYKNGRFQKVAQPKAGK